MNELPPRVLAACVDMYGNDWTLTLLDREGEFYLIHRTHPIKPHRVSLVCRDGQLKKQPTYNGVSRPNEAVDGTAFESRWWMADTPSKEMLDRFNAIAQLIL